MGFINGLSKNLFKALLKAFEEGQKHIENEAKKQAEFAKPKKPFKNIIFKAGNIPAAEYFRFQSFTTAVIHEEAIREKVKEAIVKNLRQGLGERAFYKAVNDTFKKAGLGDPKKLVSNSYATSTALAYGAGQQAMMLELKDTFPYWQYSAVMDANTRATHRALHGKIFKADDQEFYPPLGYRCRCTAIPLTARRAGKEPKENFMGPQDTEAMAAKLQNKEFIGNKQRNFLAWAEDKYATASPGAQSLIRKASGELDGTLTLSMVPPKLLSRAAKIVERGYAGVKRLLARKPVSTERIRLESKKSIRWAKENIDPYEGLKIESNNLKTGKIIIRRSSIKSIVSHTYDIKIKAYARVLASDISSWEYIGKAKTEEGKHLDADYFLYYKKKLGGKTRYLNVKLTKTEGEVVYAITEKIIPVKK